jgi:hypothetical protein
VDLETSSAIESLGQRLTAVEDTLRGEIRQLRDDVHDEMRAMRGDMRVLRGDMQVMREELMRHAMVLTESVRDDVRIVAEGLAAVSAKIDALRR